MGITDFRFLFRQGAGGDARPVQTEKKHGGSHRRTASRHAIDGLQSTFGAVVDLSQSGMRIWTTREPRFAPGTCVPLVLADGDQRMDVLATVMWVRPLENETGWQIGMRFENADAVRKQAIETYVKAGYFTTDPSIRRTLHEHDPSYEDPRQSEPHAPARPPLNAELIDLYALLGVSSDAPAETIHTAYRHAARACHPDQSDDPAAAERFARLSRAYGVLKDAETRAKYDQVLRRLAA
ncbi:MAG: DnaJ domain-containing protein [Phycisphaerales bacterium]